MYYKNITAKIFAISASILGLNNIFAMDERPEAFGSIGTATGPVVMTASCKEVTGDDRGYVVEVSCSIGTETPKVSQIYAELPICGSFVSLYNLMCDNLEKWKNSFLEELSRLQETIQPGISPSEFIAKIKHFVDEDIFLELKRLINCVQNEIDEAEKSSSKPGYELDARRKEIQTAKSSMYTVFKEEISKWLGGKDPQEELSNDDIHQKLHSWFNFSETVVIDATLLVPKLARGLCRFGKTMTDKLHMDADDHQNACQSILSDGTFDEDSMNALANIALIYAQEYNDKELLSRISPAVLLLLGQLLTWQCQTDQNKSNLARNEELTDNLVRAWMHFANLATKRNVEKFVTVAERHVAKKAVTLANEIEHKNLFVQWRSVRGDGQNDTVIARSQLVITNPLSPDRFELASVTNMQIKDPRAMIIFFDKNQFPIGAWEWDLRLIYQNNAVFAIAIESSGPQIETTFGTSRTTIPILPKMDLVGVLGFDNFYSLWDLETFNPPVPMDETLENKNSDASSLYISLYGSQTDVYSDAHDTFLADCPTIGSVLSSTDVPNRCFVLKLNGDNDLTPSRSPVIYLVPESYISHCISSQFKPSSTQLDVWTFVDIPAEVQTILGGFGFSVEELKVLTKKTLSSEEVKTWEQDESPYQELQVWKQPGSAANELGLQSLDTARSEDFTTWRLVELPDEVYGIWRNIAWYLSKPKIYMPIKASEQWRNAAMPFEQVQIKKNARNELGVFRQSVLSFEMPGTYASDIEALPYNKSAIVYGSLLPILFINPEVILSECPRNNQEQKGEHFVYPLVPYEEQPPILKDVSGRSIPLSQYSIITMFEDMGVVSIDTTNAQLGAIVMFTANTVVSQAPFVKVFNIDNIKVQGYITDEMAQEYAISAIYADGQPMPEAQAYFTKLNELSEKYNVEFFRLRPSSLWIANYSEDMDISVRRKIISELESKESEVNESKETSTPNVAGGNQAVSEPISEEVIVDHQQEETSTSISNATENWRNQGLKDLKI